MRKIFAFENFSYISPYQQLICLWNFQVGNNNKRISKSSSRKRSTSFYSVFLLYFWKIIKFFLMLSFLGGCKYFSSNWYHKWQSFPLIQWTSKKFYIFKFVFIERKKWELTEWWNFRIWISHKKKTRISLSQRTKLSWSKHV